MSCFSRWCSYSSECFRDGLFILFPSRGQEDGFFFINIKDTSKGFLAINHTITVRNRRIKVDIPQLIQGCDGSDAIILDLDDEWPEYKYPTGAHDAYHVGDKITYNGKHYTCIYDGCVWTPDTYPQGWQLVE